MNTIPVPIWIFVIIIIFAFIGFIVVLLIFLALLLCFVPVIKNTEDNHCDCPDKLDPDYNPEYIPHEEKDDGENA